MIWLLLIQVFFIMITIAYLLSLFSKEKKIQEMEVQLEEEFTKKLQRTNLKAQNMIQGAVFKSKQIFEEAKAFKKITEEETNTAIHESFDKYLESIQENTNHIVSSYEDLFKNIEEDLKKEETGAVNIIEQSTQVAVGQIHDQILKSLIDYQNKISEKAEKEFENIKKEINIYKENRLKDLEKNIMDNTSKIMLDVIGRNIDMVDQRRIILEVLDKAKKQGVFDYGN